jgi:glycosyltransferase involved in cell wall biosynthesis
MSKPVLSLAMIVKNEQYNLYTCLQQVRELVDEIVIVDTGSTDKTVEVAEQFNASVYHYRWNENFSCARNFSLKKCNGKWILVLDADEFIDGPMKYKVRELIDRDDFVGFNFEQFTYLNKDVTPDFRLMPVMRLFPNHPSLRFKGMVQEKIICNDMKLGFKEIPSGIRIWHYGYIDIFHPVKEKYNRDLNIYLRNLKKNPKDPFLCFFISLQYVSLGRYDEGLKYLDFAIKYGSSDFPYYSCLFSSYAGILNKLGRYNEAKKMAELALSKDRDLGEACFNLGEALRNLGDCRTAITMFEKAIENYKSFLFFQDLSRATWRAYSEIGLSYVRLKEMKEAVEAFLKSLSIKSFYPPLMICLSYLYKEMDDLENTEKYLKAAYEQEITRVDLAMELYNIYKKTGRLDLAAATLEGVYLYNTGNMTLLLDLARAFDESGDNNKAINYYNIYIKENLSVEPEVYLRRGICLFRTGSTKKARDDFEACSRENMDLLRKVFLEELVKQ